MVFMRASFTKQGFRGNGRLLGKFVAQIKSKGTKWMENVTRKVGPPRLKDHKVFVKVPGAPIVVGPHGQYALL